MNQEDVPQFHMNLAFNLANAIPKNILFFHLFVAAAVLVSCALIGNQVVSFTGSALLCVNK